MPSQVKHLSKVYGLPSGRVTELLRSGELNIDVVGIGNMGLPVAALLAREGANVIGVRRNARLVDQINMGICPIRGEPGLDDMIRDLVSRSKLRPQPTRRVLRERRMSSSSSCRCWLTQKGGRTFRTY